MRRYLITMILGMGLASSVAFSQQDTCGWVIGVEGRFAQTWDHGLAGFRYSNNGDCSYCPEIEDFTGTTWTTGVTVEYNVRESKRFEHGPFLLFQWLGRSLSGVSQSDRVPSLDSEGNVVFSELYREIVTTTQHLAGSAGYGISYADIRFKASIGVLQALWVSGEEYVRVSWPGLLDPSLFPDGEPIDHGRAVVLYRFNEEDINQTQVILQASLTYAVRLDHWEISVGPYYGHTFSSTLTRASGNNLSIDDLGGTVHVQYAL